MICKGDVIEVRTMGRERVNEVLRDFPKDSITGRLAVSLLQAMSILQDLVKATNAKSSPKISHALQAANKFQREFEGESFPPVN